MKLDGKYSYLTIFSCQFGRHRFTSQPFRIVPTDEMFQQKTKKNQTFRDLPNVVGIVDDILIVLYEADERINDRTLRQEMQIYHEEYFKLKENK